MVVRGRGGRGGRWLVSAAVLAVAVLLLAPTAGGVLWSRSDGPWGAKAEQWTAQFLLAVGGISGDNNVAAAFYAPDAEVDLRPQMGLVVDAQAALGRYESAIMIDDVGHQGAYLGSSGVVVLLAAPPLLPFAPGRVVAPFGSATQHLQVWPRHYAVVLELGEHGITRQAELAAPDTWGSAPRRCDDAVAERVRDRYLSFWSGGVPGAEPRLEPELYATDTVLVDGALGRSAEGAAAIAAWATELQDARGAPRLLPLTGAEGRPWYVTCTPLAAPDRMVLALQRLDERGCPIDYVADLGLDPNGRVVDEEWFTSPSSARRCVAGEELVNGVWDEVEIPPPVAAQRRATLERYDQVIALVDSTPALADQLEWALRRYEQAGLRAPVVRKVTWVDRDDHACQVVNGLAVSRRAEGFEVTLCFDHEVACRDAACSMTQPWTRAVLLHELAHVWLAQHADAAVEAAYLDHARLRYWSRPATPYHLRGLERACWDVAFGLMDEPSRLPSPSASECRWYDDGFRLLTGVDPLTSACA